MSRDLERKLLALADVCRLAHDGLLSPDCCVMATRTGLAVLEKWRIKARGHCSSTSTRTTARRRTAIRRSRRPGASGSISIAPTALRGIS